MLTIVGLGCLACAGLGDPGDGDAPTVVPGTPVEPVPEAPEPNTSPELPESPFVDWDGWIGLVGATDADVPWLPGVDGVVVVPAGAWDGVTPGTVFRGIGSSTVELTLRGVEEVPWGCDGRTVRGAVLEPATPVDPGVVWVVPADALEGASVVVPRLSRAATRERRLYRIGGGEVDLRGGRTVVEMGPKRLWDEPFDGPAAVDLRRGDAVGPSYPELLLRPAGAESVLVFRQHTAEGVIWEAVWLERGASRSLGAQEIAGCE